MIYLTDKQLTQLTKRIEKENLEKKGRSLNWSALYDKLCLYFAEELRSDEGLVGFKEDKYFEGIDYIKGL